MRKCSKWSTKKDAMEICSSSDDVIMAVESPFF